MTRLLVLCLLCVVLVGCGGSVTGPTEGSLALTAGDRPLTDDRGKDRPVTDDPDCWTSDDGASCSPDDTVTDDSYSPAYGGR